MKPESRLKYVLFLCFLFQTILAQSQIVSGSYGYYVDAGRFNSPQYNSTARMVGIGGAGCALGGDMGVTAINPAGLGMYRKSEVSITPTFGFTRSSANYLNSAQTDGKSYLSFNQFGIVFNSNKDAASAGAFRGGSFSINFSKLNNFQGQYSFSGTNKSKNLGDSFAQASNGTPSGNIYPSDPQNITSLTSLALYSFVTNVNADDTSYYTFYQGNPVKQEGILNNRGGQYKWDIAYGANFNDKLYIGASLGVQTIKYISQLAFRETPGKIVNNVFIATPDTLNYLIYHDYLKVTGTGVNLKIGVTYKLADWIRVSGAIATPTVYSMKDSYNQKIEAHYQPGIYAPNTIYPLGDQNNSTSPGTYNYNFTDAPRATGGLAIFFKKKGFISTDLEWVGYNMSGYHVKHTSQDFFVFSADNQTIRNIYRSTLNSRVGLELRGKILRFRTGFAYLADPTKHIDNLNRSVMKFSLGTGFKIENYYVDIAFVNARYKSMYTPYTLKTGTAPIATFNNSNINVVITGGIYF